MHPDSTSIAKQLGAAIAVAFVLFATAMPAAAVCCLERPGSEMSMHASMPCCGDTCTMSSPSGSRHNDVAIVVAPSPEVAVDPVVVVTFQATDATMTTVSTATGRRTWHEFLVPPPFLANAQFRI